MLLTFVPALAYPVALAASLAGALVPPDMIVVLKSDCVSTAEMARLHRTYRMSIAYPCAAMKGFAVYSSPEVIRGLRGDRAVAKLLPNNRNYERLCAGS